MSFLNSGIDVTSFMGDSFDTGMAVNARNKANAYMKGSAAKRAGDLAGKGLGLFGEFKGKDFLADAGAYAQQQQQKADMFGTVMNLVGGIGGRAALGGFGKPATQFSQPVFGQPGARETIGGYGGDEFFKPSDIPGFDYSPIPLQT
jgi:hypothetical protein